MRNHAKTNQWRAVDAAGSGDLSTDETGAKPAADCRAAGHGAADDLLVHECDSCQARCGKYV